VDGVSFTARAGEIFGLSGPNGAGKTTTIGCICVLFHVHRGPNRPMVVLVLLPRMLTFNVRAAGKRRDPPVGFEQSVPGTMVMFTLLVLFTSGAVSLPIVRGVEDTGSALGLGANQIEQADSALRVDACGRLVVYGSLAATLGMLLGNFGSIEGQVNDGRFAQTDELGESPISVLPNVCVTAVAALIVGYVLARTFRFQ
jgi:energy-coupling factor transporter ATP-binding protein EcfA2